MPPNGRPYLKIFKNITHAFWIVGQNTIEASLSRKFMVKEIITET